MKTGVIFHETLKLLNAKARRVVHQGGQSSGKTVGIEQALGVFAAQNPGTVITITSMSFPHLRSGAMRDFERYTMPHLKHCIKQWHKTEHTAFFKNGSLIEFKPFETEQDARGAKRDIIYVNEANSFEWMKFFQLDARSKISIIDYNPSIRFWCHEKLIGEEGTHLRISDHRHNPFLEEVKHREIENYCIRDASGKIVKGDYELWKVYARGLTGNVTGLIFPNWTMINDEAYPQDADKVFFGIDFGYTNDPTALMKVAVVGENVFVKEIAYKTGEIPPRTIKQLLDANDWSEGVPVYCEHDPEMIRQLRMCGVTLALKARKGAGSINAGIEKIKEYRMYYTGTSRNLKGELEKYKWKVNEEGKSTNTPIDMHNHAIDATRMAVYTNFFN